MMFKKGDRVVLKHSLDYNPVFVGLKGVIERIHNPDLNSFYTVKFDNKVSIGSVVYPSYDVYERNLEMELNELEAEDRAPESNFFGKDPDEEKAISIWKANTIADAELPASTFLKV